MSPLLKQYAAILCLPFTLSTTVRTAAVRGIPPAIGAVGAVEVRTSLNAATVPDSQSSDGLSWDTLPSMRAGVKLRLLLADGSEVVGELVAARADAVVLNRNEVRKGLFTAPAGMSLRDPLTFPRSNVVSVTEDKGWPLWGKVLLWVGIGYAVAGAIIGSIVGNS
jgi:hypothetical protein